MCMCMHTNIYVHTYTHMRMHMHMYIYIFYACICRHTCMYMRVTKIIKEGAKNLDRSKGGGVWRGKERGLM